ncbi:MAG: hypothetical protein WBY53_19760 [Acidobacteriaceae bacterium]
MRSRFRLISFAVSAVALPFVVAATLVASAQTPPERKAVPDDAAWAKTYATDCGAAMKHRCPPSTSGYENEFAGDPRFLPLIKHSLPQRESWWVNGYGGSAPVSSIVQEFIGVPGDLLLDDNRYVTATGCVPHDCGDGGMLWVDTGTQPATVVFIAHVAIESPTGDAGKHLWLYGSKTLNFQALPSDLLANLQRWHSSLVASVQKLPEPDRAIFSKRIALATIVQPNGRMRDLTYDMLFYKQNESHFPTPGAKQ